jgi:RecA-family ATPase
MISGDGGTGKSLLCLQLQVAAALGQPWMGIELPQSMPSFGFYCEDDDEELHRRLYDICRHYGCEFRDLEGMVRFTSRVGEQNELMTFWGRNDDGGKRTSLLTQIEDDVRMCGARLIIIDTVADTFAGNENIRPQVRAFITALRRLALINNGGVIVTAHPSVSGLADGSGRSGSTGWNGSVRSRIYFYKPKNPDKDIDGEDEPTNERVLKTMKSNYGPAGEKMRCQWEHGVFVRTDLAASAGNIFDRLDQERKILDAATYLVTNGSMLASDHNAKTSLNSLARKLPTCRQISWSAAAAAQDRLVAAGKLVKVELGPKSRRRLYIRPAHLRYPGEDSGETDESIPQSADGQSYPVGGE